MISRVGLRLATLGKQCAKKMNKETQSAEDRSSSDGHDFRQAAVSETGHRRAQHKTEHQVKAAHKITKLSTAYPALAT